MQQIKLFYYGSMHRSIIPSVLEAVIQMVVPCILLHSSLVPGASPSLHSFASVAQWGGLGTKLMF